MRAYGFLLAFLLPIPAWPLTVINGEAVEIDGERLECPGSEIRINNSIPSEAAASSGYYGRSLIEINLRLVRQLSPAVQKFIFYHECGHNHGRLRELDADKFAITQAVTEGWLTESVARAICRSFGPMDAPASPPHPAPRVRCAQVRAAVIPDFPLVLTQRPRPPAPVPSSAPAPEPENDESLGSGGFFMDSEADVVR